MKAVKTSTLILFFACFMALPSQAQKKLPAGAKKHVILVDNVKREFIVYTPGSYSGKTPVPVVYMFHGTSGTGEKFLRISRWREKADQEGFIAVFPTGLKYPYINDDGKQVRKTKWDGGVLATVVLPGTPVQDDIKFVHAMMDSVEAHRNIDPKHVYVSGFSNGAGFVSRLAVEMSDRIAAVAAVAGMLQLENPIAVEPIPFYLMVGRRDPGVIEKNNGQMFPMDPDSLMAVDENIRPAIDPLLSAMGLSDSFQARQRPKHTTLRFSNSLNGGDNVLIFSLVEGLEHKYPNETNNPAKFVAANKFYEFFMAHPKP